MHLHCLAPCQFMLYNYAACVKHVIYTVYNFKNSVPYMKESTFNSVCVALKLSYLPEDKKQSLTIK